MRSKKFILIVMYLFSTVFYAQKTTEKWRDVIYKSAESWYKTEEAKQVANQVLLYQREIGGWPKNIEMHIPISEEEVTQLTQIKRDPKGCTIDNGATIQELEFLLRVYAYHPEDQFKFSFLKGLLYLISAQYKNGGWPQFYPLKDGYYSHITYNDDAMVNVLNLFQDILNGSDKITIDVAEDIKTRIRNSFQKGIDCILKTQFKQNGVLTAWCAQHDRETLEPAKARAYELPSLSGRESAKITLLLMSIENPSPEVKQAVEAAVAWFEKTKITGIALETVVDEKGKQDRVIVERLDAEPLWARFMELKDNRPFFCDRNGKKKYDISEISHERRNGYGWYTNQPKEVLKRYDRWKQRVY
jgi:PelA/Pel-15E family pectate lyase